VPAPSGREERLAAIVGNKVKAWGYTPETDGAGNVLVRLAGAPPAPVVLFCRPHRRNWARRHQS
jgi:putative aminopeptidase FrvX